MATLWIYVYVLFRILYAVYEDVVILHQTQLKRAYTDKTVVGKDKKKVDEAVVERMLLNTPILVYHYVEHVLDSKDTIRIALATSPEVFQKQIASLKFAGYEFISMAEFGEALEGTFAMPKKPIILTFDDGYEDFYTDVYPILVRYNVKATVYVISHVLGKPNYMTAAQIQKISRNPLIEIAAHTRTHIDVREKEASVLEQEIMGSKKDLERLTGLAVRSFAYPYGAYDQEAKAWVQKSSYLTAVSTTISKHSAFDRFSIERIRPYNFVDAKLVGYIDREIINRNTTKVTRIVVR